jgi:transposase
MLSREICAVPIRIISRPAKFRFIRVSLVSLFSLFSSILSLFREKSRIQALERTAPLLPMLPYVPERQTVDYQRHGTTTLFAALDMLTGNVIGECEDHHRAKEYIAFLKKLNERCEKEKVLNIIADNYSTHKTKEVKEYCASVEGRFVTHFIPAHSSWFGIDPLFLI